MSVNISEVFETRRDKKFVTIDNLNIGSEFKKELERKQHFSLY